MKYFYFLVFIFSVCSCNSKDRNIENDEINKSDFIGDWTLFNKEENRYYKDSLIKSRKLTFGNENIRITEAEISFYDYPISFNSKSLYFKKDSTIYFNTRNGVERNIISINSEGNLILNRQFKNLHISSQEEGPIDREDYVYTFERTVLNDDTLRLLETKKYNPEFLKSNWQFDYSANPPETMMMRNEIFLDHFVMIKDADSSSNYHGEPYDNFINFTPTEFLNLLDSNISTIHGDAIVYNENGRKDFYKVLELRGDMLILEATSKCLCDTVALVYEKIKY